MKILFLTTYYHRAMIFSDMIRILKTRGHDVRAFNAVKYNTRIKEKYKGIMDDRVIHKECFSKWDRYFYFLKQWKIYKSMIENINFNDFDLIHSHMLFNGGYASYLINKKYNIPYVVSVRNTDENVFMKLPFFNKISDKILKNASGIQFLSPSYKKRFISDHIDESIRQNIENKSKVITNGLEDYWLENKGESRIIDDSSTINLLYVGKIDQNKNILTTVKAMKILKREGFKPGLTVIGQVVNKTILKELNKENDVNIVSYLTKEELTYYYRTNDIFVMPSIHETFGRVYAEAMTQGLPLIYSKGQGFDGLFEDGYVGYSVPSKNADYIAESILKIINNYEEISIRCIKNCYRFNWKNISEELNRFYKDSIERGKIK